MPDEPATKQEWISKKDILTFRQQIKVWGKRNFRSFPWRLTNTPYRILMAEVMLHRTKALQVVPVYERFIQQYPDLAHFLQATKKNLKASLQSLGLAWRIDLIYQMGRMIELSFGSQIPVENEDLLSLPGVSEYIASAVRCFAWNLPEPLIDTNTVRITGRFFGWDIKDSSRRSKRFRQALAEFVDPEEPRTFNYTLLDLAALVCLKKRPPLCDQCPLQAICNFGKSTRPA
jgi:A/G-specific adenine glycosylase